MNKNYENYLKYTESKIMNCLVCGSNNKKELTKLCNNMDIMGPFFHGKNSSVVSCEKCGHVYVDIDINQDAFTQYYASNYSKSLSYFEVFGKDYAEIYYFNIAHRILKYTDKKAKILDIGGGIGELAEYMYMHGFEDITVMESSPRCIELCKKRRIPVIESDTMHIINDLEKTYDFIIINHTLEHILRFDNTLSVARKMLKDTGHIYVEVPDASKYPDTDFVPYWFFTYEHLFHMSLENFDNLGAAFSFNISEKQCYYKCNSYYVMYAIFEKSNTPKTISYKKQATEAIARYIIQCKEKLEPVIQKLEQSKEKLILWGVGASTAQLLNDNFDNCNITKLIDSNPYRQNIAYRVAGKELQIQDPSTIQKEDGTILILPLMYETSIRKQIEEMKLQNKVVSLIDNYNHVH